MEFDGLKAVGYNTNPGMDYTTVSTISAANEKIDIGFSGSGNSESVKSAKAVGSAAVESMKNELKELKESIGDELFDKFVQEANKKIFTTGRQFSYKMHEATNRVAIKIIDRETKEIIREVPPEKTLDAAAKMLELVGIIFDEKI